MKKLTYLMAAGLAVLILLPAGLAYAQTPAKKSLPQVPITYPGDTEETILRRAKWIEGAKKEGNTLIWWGVPPGEVGKELAEFNKVYPAIKVEYWRAQGEEIATKLESEFISKRRTVDVCYGGEPINFPRWRKQGLMEKFTDLVPGMGKWDRRYYSPQGDSAQAGNNATTPQYNTKLVSAAEAPRSWEDLLNPKWKGQQLGMPTDPKHWWTLALGEGGWGREKTEDFLTKLKAQQPKMHTGMSQGHSLLVAGDFKIATNSYLPFVIASQAKGAPVDWARVNPVSITGPSFIMPASGPHPNAARLFIEWLLSPEGLRVHENVTGYGFAAYGSGSRLSELLKGHHFVARTEEVILKAVEIGMDEKFSKMIIGE